MNEQVTVLLGMVIQYVTGFITAKVGSDKVRKLIPVPLFVIGLLTQIIAGFQAAAGPAPVVAPAAFMAAGIFGQFGKGFLDIFVNAIIQTLIPIGAHSAQKNVRQGLALSK